MDERDRELVESLKAATAALNEALQAAAVHGIEVSPEFKEATAMEHSAPLLVLSIELTKHLGTV